MRDSVEQVIALVDHMNERILRADLVNNVHLVNFQPGKIELRLVTGAASDIPSELCWPLSIACCDTLLA